MSLNLENKHLAILGIILLAVIAARLIIADTGTTPLNPGHPLSQTWIDTNLNMGAYNIATTGNLQIGTLTGGNVPWARLTSVPAGFADGVDNTGITSETDPTVLASVKDGISWGEVSGRPAFNGCSGANLALKTLDLNTGAATCETDDIGGGGGGTVTSVSAGTGLSASPNPITGSGTISVADGGITTAKVADSAVTSAKIADGTITSADIGFNYAGSSSKGGAATTASALSADGSNCAGVQYAQGVDAGGNAQGCNTPASGISSCTDVSSSITDFSYWGDYNGDGVNELVKGVHATCPSGYYATGGGCVISDYSSLGTVVASTRSGNEWYCQFLLKTISATYAQAVCCK